MSANEKTLTDLATDVRRAISSTLDDPEMLERLERFGYSRRQLEAVLIRHELSKDNSSHTGQPRSIKPRKRTVDIAARRVNDTRRRELALWMTYFRPIACIAFQDRPEWLEKMGFDKVQPRPEAGAAGEDMDA